MADDRSMAGASEHGGGKPRHYYTIDEQGRGTWLTILPTRTLYV